MPKNSVAEPEGQIFGDLQKKEKYFPRENFRFSVPSRSFANYPPFFGNKEPLLLDNDIAIAAKRWNGQRLELEGSVGPKHILQLMRPKALTTWAKIQPKPASSCVFKMISFVRLKE